MCGTPRILSGVQPSGSLHLGNYFGAIRQHIAMQDEGDAFYFLANYHALTTSTDADLLRQRTHEAALDYLALGLDPAKATFFRQSDVPEVCELMWLLSTIASKGLLDRAVSYKDKVAKGVAARVGLFMYPMLMAADILLYDATLVPVGGDQVHHIEIARDIAGQFNTLYGQTFRLPEPRIDTTTSKILGTDGQKMSKSYGNTIGIFEEGPALRKKIMRIPSDSRPPGSGIDQNGAVARLLQIFQPGGSPQSYGEAKAQLIDCIETHFAAARERREVLAAHGDDTEDILRHGALHAKEEACRMLDRVRHACGVA